jgi:hypothetical protein
VQAVVLRCVVTRADGGGGLWWPKPMIEATCMHVWTHIEHFAIDGAPSCEFYFFILKKFIVVTSLADISRPTSSLPCSHNSDVIVATDE